MSYDNNILGYGNSQHPMHDEEQEITLEHVMGRLTIDEADFLENHITNLVKEANRKFENAKRMQREINELQKKLENLNIHKWGGTEASYNMEYSNIYRQLGDVQYKLIELLTPTSDKLTLK